MDIGAVAHMFEINHVTNMKYRLNERPNEMLNESKDINK